MSFPPLSQVQGAVAPLLLPNIDTDVIIRVERLTSADPAALAPYALEALRFHPDGSEDPQVALNQPRFRGAPILLAGANFGCGSSREPAVWALMGLGVRALVAPSFGDIFKTNCFQNGVLAVTLPDDGIDALAAATAEGQEATLDVSEQTITVGPVSWRFDLAPVHKRSLLSGRNDLELALEDLADITCWEMADRRHRPWAWPLDGAALA